MKTKLTTGCLLALALVFSSCSKDVDIFIPDGGQPGVPDTIWYADITSSMPVNVLRTQVKVNPVQDTIDGAAAVVINLNGGVQCGFPANACVNSSGTPVTGRIDVEFTYVKSKGDMIRMNRPTSSFNRVLISGGQLHITLKKNGQPVQLAPGIQLNIKFPDNPPVPQMDFFVGDGSPGAANWLSNPDVLNNTLSVSGTGYTVATNRTAWIACSYFYDTIGIARSIVHATLPSNYTNANTMLYAVLKDYNTVMALQADVSNRYFISPKLPDGKEAVIVAISKQADDYYLGYLNTVINSPSGVQQVTLSPVKKSLPEILQYLASL